MEEMRQRIDRHDSFREIEEIIQVRSVIPFALAGSPKKSFILIPPRRYVTLPKTG
jgi:hypothetical protein